MITSADRVFFQENGYLVLDNVFNINKLESIKKILQEIVWLLIQKAKTDNPSNHLLAGVTRDTIVSDVLNILETINHKHVVEFVDCLSSGNNPYIAHLLSAQKILNHVNILLDMPLSNPLFTTSCGGLFAPQKDQLYTANKWHTDVFYTHPGAQYIHLWAPLVEDSVDNLGALHIMPRSHKQPFCGQIRDETRRDSNIHKFTVSDTLLDEYEDRIIEIKLGQALFFDKHLVHRGGINVTDRGRFGLIGFYHSMSGLNFSPYSFGHPKQITDDEYFYQIMGR